MNKNKRFVFLAGCACCGSISPAFAQEAAPAANAHVGQASLPAQASAPAGVGDIVVTARRREERLQDTPIAVTALNGDGLAKAGISDVRDLTRVVPSFNGGRNYLVFQPTIRGVGSNGVSQGDESNIALYVDGIYQPDPYSNVVDLVEVERVEVLRGPQGTLFGRNATGGLINIITPDPKFDFGAHLTGSLGSFGGTYNANGGAYVTGPLSENVAADLAVRYRSNGGYLKDLVRGGDIGSGRFYSIRSKVLLNAGPAKFVLTVGYDNSRDGSNAVAPLDGNTIGNRIPGTVRADKPYDTALTIVPTARFHAFKSSLRGSVDLGGVSLESSTGFLKDHIFQASDSDASPILVSGNKLVSDNTAVSQELRLMSQGSGAFQWIAGGYFYHIDGSADADVTNGVPPTYATSTTIALHPLIHTTALAGFGEGTLSLTDKLRATAGVRYSWETRDFTQSLNDKLLIPKTDFSVDKWTYRGILQYFFTKQTNVYLSYSTGFKSGVFNTLSTSNLATKPETIGSYEFGIKSDISRSLRVNASTFWYNYKNLQVIGRLPNSQLYVQLNAQKARVRGAEAEVEFTPTSNLAFKLSGSVLDAKYLDFPNAQAFVPTGTGGNSVTVIDAGGKHMLRAPKFTLSGGINWGHDVGKGRLTIGANAFYSTKVYYDFANRLAQPNYVMLSSQIAWETADGKWRFKLYGENLGNEKVFQQITANSFADFVTYERPREVGISVELKY
jgi:iron complex outermembrane receptor protein